MKQNCLWISDTHYHNFERFSRIVDDKAGQKGVNSRLLDIIDATKEAVEKAKQNGIDTVVHGGDCFHVRGKISPTVLNPVIELYRWMIEDMGMSVYMIAGNHDLETRESDTLSNTATALASVGVNVINETYINEELQCVFVPWHSSQSDLKQQLLDCATRFDVSDYTAVIHAPLNGVIKGIPDHGLEAKELNTIGFKRIMCGHYHNFVDFGGVVSIGSLTHQSFSDITSTAGYILQMDDKLHHFETGAPKFVDLEYEDPTDQQEFEEIVYGNYVRVKLTDANETDIADMRDELDKAGALGSLITNIPTASATSTRSTKTTSGVTMQESVSEWVKGYGFSEHADDIEKAAVDLLNEV